ncbi:MAG TPA: hypothetical protein VI483_01140 [Candidatus Paceibacterota bacterium]
MGGIIGFATGHVAAGLTWGGIVGLFVWIGWRQISYQRKMRKEKGYITDSLTWRLDGPDCWKLGDDDHLIAAVRKKTLTQDYLAVVYGFWGLPNAESTAASADKAMRWAMDKIDGVQDALS